MHSWPRNIIIGAFAVLIAQIVFSRRSRWEHINLTGDYHWRKDAAEN